MSYTGFEDAPRIDNIRFTPTFNKNKPIYQNSKLLV